MLKLDQLDSIDQLLTNASNYNGEKVMQAFRQLKSHDKLDKMTSKFDLTLREKRDLNYLIYRNSIYSSSFVQMFRRAQDETWSANDDYCEDGGSYEANIYFYLVSGLFELVLFY